MESNWRMNIPDIGAAGLNWEYCARLVNPVVGGDYLVKTKGVSATARLVTPLIFPDERLVFQFTIVPVTGNFPYGYDVEPD